ncbi:MAG TPA: hypothetical protein VGP05_24130 [Pseudonocardia sp.]|nr:hypothetical protein [Pseudonocardia sp.]
MYDPAQALAMVAAGRTPLMSISYTVLAASRTFGMRAGDPAVLAPAVLAVEVCG